MATFGRYCLNIKEVLESWNRRGHFPPPPPSPRRNRVKRWGVPPYDLLRIYSSLIRSVLEYCCPVWHSSLPVHLSTEKVQKRALRIIYPVLGYPEALLTSGFTELRTRRDHLWLKNIWNDQKTAIMLKPPYTLTRACAHGRSLRFSDRSPIFKCRTERFKKSFFPNTCLKAHRSLVNFISFFIYLYNCDVN